MEILFKAQRVDNNEWIYGYYMKQCDKHIIVDTTCGSLGFGVLVKEETVCQYANLIDSEKNKIYQNDIVELCDKNSKVCWKAVVIFGNPYGNYSWGWELKYIGNNPHINTDILCWVEMEETGAFCKVVGNIFDKEKENDIK